MNPIRLSLKLSNIVLINFLMMLISTFVFAESVEQSAEYYYLTGDYSKAYVLSVAKLSNTIEAYEYCSYKFYSCMSLNKMKKSSKDCFQEFLSNSKKMKCKDSMIVRSKFEIEPDNRRRNINSPASLYCSYKRNNNASDVVAIKSFPESLEYLSLSVQSVEEN